MAIPYEVHGAVVPDRTARKQRTTGGAAAAVADAPLQGQSRPRPQVCGESGRRIRVMLADDSRAVREALNRLLELEEDIEVVGQAVDGLQAIQMALELEPDVVLMDVTMPVMGGVEATGHLRRQRPDVRIIGLSMHDEPQIADAMTRAGAVAYLSKTAPSVTLIDTIRKSKTVPQG